MTRAQRGLFDRCTATREVLAQYEASSHTPFSCPLCGGASGEHELEELIAGTVPDDASFAEWLLNLPRGQA